DHRDEQGALPDLAADLLIPDIATAQLVHVEPNFDLDRAKRLGNLLRRRCVFAGVAQEYRSACGIRHGREARTAPSRWPRSRNVPPGQERIRAAQPRKDRAEISLRQVYSLA